MEKKKIVIDCHLKILAKNNNAFLIIVPRHPEFFEIAFNYAKQQKLNPIYSKNQPLIKAENKVLIVNEMGKMLDYYNIADLAFVGGSLFPFGCQNVIEPISLNIPVIIGNSYFNFKQIVADLIVQDGITISNKDNFQLTILDLIFNKEKLEKQSNNAYQFFIKSKGALQISVQKIICLISLYD